MCVCVCISDNSKNYNCKKNRMIFRAEIGKSMCQVNSLMMLFSLCCSKKEKKSTQMYVKEDSISA